MKRKFTLRATLRSFLLLSLWLFLRPDAKAQTYCNPVFNVGTAATYTFNNITVGSTSFPIPPLSNSPTPAPSGQNETGAVTLSATSGSPTTVVITSPSTTTGGALFVDWNKDGDFNDANEFIFSFPGSASAVTNAITPAVNLPSGNYRMRLLATNNYTPVAGTACADFTSSTYSANANGNGNYIDFVLTVTNPYTCLPPDSVTNYALSATTASFVWRPSPYTSAQGYRWVVVSGGLLVNAPPITSGNSTGAAPITATGLLPSNAYSFYIRSGCSAIPTDSSLWVGPINFTTLGPQCNGVPLSVSITSSDPTPACFGSTVTLTGADPNTTVSGVTYQWQKASSRNGVYGNIGNTDGSGQTTLTYTTAPFTNDSAFYRVVTTCSFTGQQALTTSNKVEVIDTKYSLPYFEDFSTTANGQIPNCFNKNINPSYSSFSVRSDYVAADGTNIRSIRADFPSGTGSPASPNNFFTIPALNLTAGVQYGIRFNYSRSNTTYAAYLQVYASNTAPNTTFAIGSPSITTIPPAVLLFDKTGPNAINTNGVQTGLVYFTPTANGTYYFSWYTNTPEATGTTAGTAVGITNINVFVNTACSYPTGQPTAFTSSTTINSVTGMFTAPTTGANGYLVVRTPAGVSLNANPLHGNTYVPYSTTPALGQIGNGVVVYSGHNPVFIDTALLASTTYTYTVFAYNDLCSTGPLFDTVAPLISTATTIGGGKTYTWNKAVSADFQIATNWTPTRYVPDVSDILLFNNSAFDTAINIPATQLVSRLQITNNTTVRLRGAGVTPIVQSFITLRSDGDPTTNELQINNGSSLFIDDPNTSLTINFSGTGATASIAGYMELVQSANPELIDFTNAVGTITATGTLAEGNSSVNANACITSAPNNLMVFGTLNYRYPIAGPVVPFASYLTGSTFLISGVVGAATGPSGGKPQIYYNFTYNCPNQTAPNFAWQSTGGPLVVLGTLTMVASGTGAFQLSASSNVYVFSVNNYTQTGGKLDLTPGNTGTVNSAFNFSGTFNQTGGSLVSTNTGTTNNSVVLQFNGTSGVQNVNFFTVPTGPISYRIMNPNGINLTGTGTATPNFNINNACSVRISSGAANPINTTLNLVYANPSTLIYDSAAYQAPMTASVFPAASGPFNVTIAVSPGNAVTMPFNRNIGGTLTLTSGDIDVNSNTLTIGTSGSVLGTISGSGLVRLTTGGLTRWYTNTALPTTPGTGVGYYPVAYGQANRAVSIYGTGATPSAAGTITVKHVPTPGMVTFPTTNDNPVTVNIRTNAYWSFSTATMTNISGTIGIRLTPGYLFTTRNVGAADVVEATPPILGTYVAGTAGTTTPLFYAQRAGLTYANFTTNNFYVGANTADTTQTWTAINTGNWNTGSTWDIGTPPNINSPCVINTGVTVTTDAGSDVSKSLIVNGTLIDTANTLVVDSTLINNGTINVGAALNAGSLTVNGGVVIVNTFQNGIINNGIFNLAGGTVRLGPVGGSNKPFNNNGTLNITGGTFNLNGNLNVATTAYYNMSGGALNVDGTAGAIVANSVPSGTHMVNFASSNIGWTSGRITVVDPTIANATGTYAFVYSGAIPLNMPNTDTLQLGDGLSQDAGGTVSGSATAQGGFIINPGGTKFSFGTFICNTGSSLTGGVGANRYVTFSQLGGILGPLWVNGNGAEFRPSMNLDYNGNITVLAGGFFTSTAVTFAKYQNGATYYAADPLAVGGAGTYRNNITGTGLPNFTNITLTSANVLFNNTTSFAGTVAFNQATSTKAGRLYMAPGTILIENSGAGSSGASQVNGWVVGTYQKHAAVGGLSGNFPIGDSSLFTPIASIGATASVAGDLQGSVYTTTYPGISGSILNPTKTLRRYFTVVPVNGLNFTPGSTANIQLNFAPGDISAGANYAKLLVAHDATTTGAGPWTYLTPTVTPISPTNFNLIFNNIANLQSTYVIGEACPPTTVITQPVSVSTCSGTPVTFTTNSTGLSLSYQWQVSVNGGTFTNVPGATSPTLSFSNPAITDTGTYRLVVTGICSAPMFTNNVVLSLTSAATITSQPASQSVCVGSPVTFTITATGVAPVTYQWYKNWIPLGVSGTTYSIPAAALTDAGNITVTATNTCRTDTSAVAVLLVNPLPLAFITASGPTTICTGGDVVLSATTGTGYTYQWYMNGVAGVITQNDTATLAGGYHVTITDGNGCSATSGDDSVKVIPAPTAGITFLTTPSFCVGGSTTMVVTDTLSTYTYNWLHGDGTGGYIATTPGNSTFVYTATATDSFKVVVFNSVGCSDTSSTAYVTANALPNPIITSTTASTSICQGICDTLEASPHGTGITYVWYNSGAAQPSTDSFYVACSSGSYSVKVTNQFNCSATSAATVITVNAPPVATATAQGPTTFCPGGSVVLAGNTGTGDTYGWYIKFGNNLIHLASTQSYTATNSGTYTFVLTNASGCSDTAAAITVTEDAATATITAGGPLSVCNGSSVSLCANNVAGGTYNWQQNLNGSWTGNGVTTQCYSASTAGQYRVIVTNGTGCSATSTAVTVNILPVPIASAAVTDGTTTFCQGGSVTMCTNSTGNGYTYQWIKGTAIGGATQTCYTATTSGTYQVVVANSVGCKDTSEPGIIVNAVAFPTATITPAGPTSICANTTVALTANTGTGYTYQWQVDTGTGYVNIMAANGGTAQVYNAGNTGNYVVIVTNVTGCATTSTPVNVFVNPVPVIDISGPTTFCWGSSVTLTVDAGTGTGLSYQWIVSVNGDPFGNVSGGTNPSLTITQPGGLYSAIVTVINSCFQSSDTVNVVVNPLPLPVITFDANNNMFTGTFVAYQWYKDGQPITGATTSSYSATEPGDYRVLVTGDDGCSSLSDIHHIGTTGVTNINGNIDVNIYPNPATSVIHIDAPVKVNVTIMAIDGKVVMQQDDATTMDISKLANGVYTVRVTDKDGSLIKIQKLVKNGE